MCAILGRDGTADEERDVGGVLGGEAGRDLGDGMEVPDYGPYAKADWPQPEKGRAAMIHLLDRDVGRTRDRGDSTPASTSVCSPSGDV